MTQYSTHPQKIKIRDDNEDVLEINSDGSISIGDGTYKALVTYEGSLQVETVTGTTLDAFGRQRVSSPTTVFDSTFRYGLQPLIYETSTANNGSVTHGAAKSAAILSLDGTAGGEAIIQSKAYHRYIPGKSHLIEMTQTPTAAVAGVVKQFGYNDANDGIFFEQNGTTDIAFVRRSSVSGSPVDERVTQANWSQDSLDGDGPSGQTLNLANGQIFMADLQWLGMGHVRVGFNINGRFVDCHHFEHSNNLSTVYMRTGTLPIRWRIAGDSAATMEAVCASVQSEGGSDSHFSYQFAYDRATITAGNGTQTYAFSIRPKATFNSITNRIKLDPIQWQAQVLGNSPVLVEIYYGTTVGGTPSWTDMDATYSALQVDTAGTPSGGIKVASFWAASSASGTKMTAIVPAMSRYPLVLDMAGTGYNHYTVYVTGIGGTSNVRPGITWVEDR